MASAANRTITGVVISGEDNEPLIGASVYVHTDELKKAGAKVLEDVQKAGKFAVVLASRPYQNDALVNHDLPLMFT